MINSVREFIGTINHGRSTVLKSLFGLCLILLPATISSFVFAPEWFSIGLSIALAVSFLIFFITFIYCLFTNPNLLRSEKHTEQMSAIEKGFYIGDSDTGFIKLESSDKRNLLPPSASEGQK